MIILTGATGFVGRQILKYLTNNGYDVRLIIRAGAITAAERSALNLEVVDTPDLFSESAETLQDILRGVDTLIHTAWYAEPGKYLSSTRNLECLTGTLRLAQAFHLAGGRRFVGLGSCAEYDVSAGVITPDTPLKPGTLYAAAKTAAFQVLDQWLPKEGIEFAWCRLFYLYGEGEDSHRLVPYIRQRLAAGEPAKLTSGHQIRDFLNVKEAGAMIAQTALGHRQGPVNICSGIPVTVRQLAERIANEYGRRDLLQFGARPENQFDPPSVVGVRENTEE